MTRDQLTHEIAALDRQINQEIAANKLSNTNLKHRSFPTGNWIGAIFFLGLGLIGPTFMKQIAQFSMLILLVGVIFTLFAIWRTIMFLIKGRIKYDKRYGQAMEKVAVLQAQRQELQKKLKEMGG